MSTVKIISWNVNGFRAACRKGFVEWLDRSQPDILCLQETKANEDQITSELACITGYHWAFSSAEKKGYSGVAVFSKTKPLEVRKGFGEARFDSEGRTLVVDYGDFLLFNIYFPNGKSGPERLAYKMAFYESFRKHTAGLRDGGKKLVICGDVNTAHTPMDLARPKENEKISGFLPEERAWMDAFMETGFRDTFRMFNQEGGNYTWWDMKSGARARNVGWRIDYFFVSDNLQDKVQSAFISPEVIGSDHCPIGLELKRD